MPFKDPAAPGFSGMENTSLFRWATFLPAIAISTILILVIMDWFRKDGFLTTEILMMALVGFSAFWIALSVSASIIGLLFPRQEIHTSSGSGTNNLDVALLVPIYNEDADAVFSRLRAMHRELSSSSSNHRFAVFVLSDTRDERIASQEAALFESLRHSHATEVPFHYRRRVLNIERKTGNVREWIEGWGADWDAFITLDADSLMSARSITRLADEMACQPGTGLIQTVPRLIGSNTLFSRIQQFANNIYGPVLARGLDRWSGHEGNYWGHNAIIRTRAFAACAGLPVLPGKGALGGTIKSHDFVEAALLRRAGWSVRLLPDLAQSYEETPQTIVDYVLRDRRWCQGNLQHLRLLLIPGLHMTSRFHMLQGAMAYISSLAWFSLLVVWALMGRGAEDNVFRYFAHTNPLFPQWPQMDTVSRLVVLAFTLGLLLTPKLLGLVETMIKDPTLQRVGGRRTFLLGAVCELLLSFLLAPILMVQHVSAVLRTVLGRDAGWSPQNRNGGNYGFSLLLRFHGLETCIGLMLMSGIFAGVISLWLAPIAVSLLCAVPVSHWFSKPGTQMPATSRLMETEERRAPPPIIRACYA